MTRHNPEIDKKIDEIIVGGIYLKTTKMKANSISKHQPNTIVDDECCYQSYKVQVHSVEDKGNYYHVGYYPLDRRFGEFGYCKIRKNTTGRFGTVGFKKCF